MLALTQREALDQTVASEFDQLIQGLTAWAYAEHDQNGHHTDITAYSLTIDAPSLANGIAGTITFQDENGKKTVFARTATDGTLITLASGQTVLIRNQSPSGVIENLVRLGQMQVASGTFNGIAMLSPVPGFPTIARDWAMGSALASFGNAASLLFVDQNANLAPMMLRWRGATTGYELMKTIGSLGPTTQPVSLGSRLDSSLQGFWDEVDAKSLYLQTVAGQAAQVGQFIDQAFNAGDFGGLGGQTWTVILADVATFGFTFFGPTMRVEFDIVNTTIGGTPNPIITIAVPGGFSSTKSLVNTILVTDNGTPTPAFAQIGAGQSVINISKVGSANFTGSVGNNHVQGHIEFPVA